MSKSVRSKGAKLRPSKAQGTDSKKGAVRVRLNSVRDAQALAGRLIRAVLGGKLGNDRALRAGQLLRVWVECAKVGALLESKAIDGGQPYILNVKYEDRKARFDELFSDVFGGNDTGTPSHLEGVKNS